MSLSDLASLGSFASGVAVLISLVFLYFQLRQVAEQVRQTERNQRATIAQVRANRTVDVMLRGCDASMSDAFLKATRGEADITTTQLNQFVSFARAVFINAEDTFHQHRDGLLGDGAYRAFVAAFGQNMAWQAYRSAWRLSGRRGAGQEFAEFVDQLMDETPMVMASDLRIAWRSDFAEIQATASPGSP